MADLDAAAAAARLERRGGQVELRARVRANRSFFKGKHEGWYSDGGRVDGAVRLVGSHASGEWILATDADRARLVADIQHRLDGANADADGPAIEYYLRHLDYDDDPGFAQIGCVFALGSIVVGWIVGLILAWVIAGEASWLAVLAAPVLGFVATLAVGLVDELVLAFPSGRDHVATIGYGWMAVAPGIVTALTLVAIVALQQ